MIDANELVDALVAHLQDVPDLEAVLGADAPARITGYKDQFPTQVSLPLAIQKMQSGAVLVAYQGWETASRSMETYYHRVSLFLRAPSSWQTNFGHPYSAMARAILRGTRSNGATGLLYT